MNKLIFEDRKGNRIIMPFGQKRKNFQVTAFISDFARQVFIIHTHSDSFNNQTVNFCKSSLLRFEKTTAKTRNPKPETVYYICKTAIFAHSNSSWKMISRRNIRVKVMQTLYTVSTLENDVKPGEPQKLLLKHFDQTSDLFFYLTYFLIEVAQYAEKDATIRAGKHLPSYHDLHVNTKISDNDVLKKLKSDPVLIQQFDKRKTGMRVDKELLRKIYNNLSSTTRYKEYIGHKEREKKEEKDILEYILNDLMLANESFVSHIEENFSNWDDDGDMVIQLLVGALLKPNGGSFNEMISLEKLEFAKGLLKAVLEKNEHLQDLIIPKLKNWDPERIAQLDMILMKMGVSEFLYFETIPPKVTINEYIDLAKDYSTAQSGQFVNGILDNIHKEMVQEGKMHKVEFKKA